MSFTNFIPLITGGMSAIASVFGGNASSKAARQANQEAREWQYEMWKMNNEYNTPANQKQRLIDAKLNPSLMYQTMPQNVSQSFDQPAGDPTAPAKIQADMYQNVANQMQSGVNSYVQNEYIRAQTAKILQEVDFAKGMNPLQIGEKQVDILGKEKDLIRKELENKFKEMENQYGNEYLLLRNKGMQLNTDQLAKAISYMDENQSLFVREKLGVIANLAEQTKLMTTEQAKNLAETERIKILTEIDSLEKQYREKGMSFNDFIVFREIKSSLMNLFKGLSSASGKKNNENTIVQSAARAILDMLLK